MAPLMPQTSRLTTRAYAFPFHKGFVPARRTGSILDDRDVPADEARGARVGVGPEHGLISAYVERKLASQDKRFQAALDEAGALSGIHEASRGAEFEGEARSALARFLPYTYQVHDGFLRPVQGLKKQLDIVIRSRFLPEFWQEVTVELITVAGEVKTTLSDDGRNDYFATAAKLASAAALAGRRRPLPFFALAGALRRSTGHAAWLASLVSNASAAAASVPGLWPAAFSFDEREPMSAISVGPTAPLSAVTADGRNKPA
jgi:hypothetical protein